MRRTDAMVQTVIDLLAGEDGLLLSLRRLGAVVEDADPSRIGERVFPAYAPAEIVERCLSLRKPALLVYCKRFANHLEEKFRERAGRYEMVIEVISTHERIEVLTPLATLYADAVADVLGRKSGCIAEGITLRERVEIQYEPAKRGGAHLHETARVMCTLESRGMDAES